MYQYTGLNARWSRASVIIHHHLYSGADVSYVVLKYILLFCGESGTYDLLF